MRLQELYNLRSVYGQRKRALEFCNSTFTTIGEKKFCILHLLEDVKVCFLIKHPRRFGLVLWVVCPVACAKVAHAKTVHTTG